MPILSVVEREYDNGWTVVGRITVDSSGAFKYEATGANGDAKVVTGLLSAELMNRLRADLSAGVAPVGSDGTPTYTVEVDNTRVRLPSSIEALLNQVRSELRDAAEQKK